MRSDIAPGGVSTNDVPASRDPWGMGLRSGERGFRRARRHGGGVLLRRVLKSALAVLLAASLLPLVPVTPSVDEAEALEGSTDYSQLFNFGNACGSPASISGDTLRIASTIYQSDYSYHNGLWESSSGFISKRAFSLLNTWEISVNAMPSGLSPNSYTEQHDVYYNIGLSTHGDVSAIDGWGWVVRKYWSKASGFEPPTFERWQMIRGVASTIEGPVGTSWATSISLSYDAIKDTITYRNGITVHSFSNVRSYVGNSAYVYLGGGIRWIHADGSAEPHAPSSMTSRLRFNSVSLPRLSPIVDSIKLFRENGNPISETDTVQKGELVRVECTVRNKDTSSASGGFSESYPMHIKLADTAEHPTRGLLPFANASHPVQVNGTTVATSKNDNTITGSNGVPVTLVGTSPTTVSWWAEVTGAQGTGVILSQQLIEDSLQGSQYSTVKLVDEQPLTPAPGDADPDDPGSWGTPGTDYHYTRLPVANENGWNSTPVTITFYPGDYDVMDLSPSEGAGKKLTGADPAWTRSADTEGVSLSGQARNSSTGAISIQRAGKVKIDSSAPRIEKGAALEGYTIDDAPDDPGKVSSGVWRLHRVAAPSAVDASHLGASAAPSNAVASAASASAPRDSVFREFELTGEEGDRKGAISQIVGSLPNGWYVAEDAAGNRSAPLRVGSTPPPAVDRPDFDDPDAPDPAGPPVGSSDPVPPPTETEDADGLRHAVVNETVTEVVNKAAPAFGGSLTSADAEAIMNYRYALTSPAGDLAVTTELLGPDGGPIASLPTDVPGSCLIRRVATDEQGNTTTVNLRYSFVEDNCPAVRPWKPADPSDPDGPKVPGDPIDPTGPVQTGPGGVQSAEVSVDVTEAVTRGVMAYDEAVDLLRRHFDLASVGGEEPSITVQSMENAAGNRIASIDLSRAADYRITYLLRDKEGNATTVRLGYHLIASKVPGVVVTPDPGTDPDPRPGDDPLNPRPRPIDPSAPPTVAPDGTQHADIDDVMQVKVRPGEKLGEAEVRSLMGRRYAFTPEGGGSVNEQLLSVSRVGVGAVDAIDLSRPGAFLITYKVADGAGSTVTVRLRYLVVSDPPALTPTDPDGSDGSGGGDDPGGPGDGPGGSGGGSGDGSGGPGGGSGGEGPGGSTPSKPLVPVEKVVDRDTGLTHVVVKDHVIVGTQSDPLTPEAMAALIQRRYLLTASVDGAVERGEVRLFDAAGNPVSAIDRSRPGTWLAEQVMTDAAGNTTTLRLTYEVRANSADGSMGGTGDGSGLDGSGGDGSGSGANAGDGIGSGTASSADKGDWASRLRRLPQTGGLFGPCPLHMMFVLMMLLVSAYTLMRLRQERGDRAADRRERRRATY